MKSEATYHLNGYAAARMQQFGSWPGGQSVYGKVLEEGDVLEATDVYDSTTGNWEPCPVPGLPVGPGGNATWIRPEVQL